MITRVVYCDIGTIWDGTDRMKVYMEDNNILPMASAIEIYI